MQTTGTASTEPQDWHISQTGHRQSFAAGGLRPDPKGSDPLTGFIRTPCGVRQVYILQRRRQRSPPSALTSWTMTGPAVAACLTMSRSGSKTRQIISAGSSSVVQAQVSARIVSTAGKMPTLSNDCGSWCITCPGKRFSRMGSRNCFPAPKCSDRFSGFGFGARQFLYPNQSPGGAAATRDRAP